MSETVGYSRWSSGTTRDRVERALEAGGAARVAVEASPGEEAIALEACLTSLMAGDTLLVVDAADLAPTLDQLFRILGMLDERGILFRSLAEPELSTDGGPALPADMVRAVESLRRRLVAQATEAAPTARRPGRPSVMTEEKVAMALELRRQNRSITHIARLLGVSASAVRRAVTRPLS